MRVNVCLLCLLLVFPAVFADAKSDAERKARDAFREISATRDMRAGLERDSLLQKAYSLFAEALDLYARHLEEHPEEAGALEPRLTEINSQMFWCSKLTTMAYYNAHKTEREIIPDAPEVKTPAVENGPEAAETRRDAAVIRGPVDKAVTEAFLMRIEELMCNRRFYEIRSLCRKMQKQPEPGLDTALPGRMLIELDYSDLFVSSVFDKLMDPGPDPIVHLRSEGGHTQKMIFRSLDQGLVQMDIQEPGIEQTVQIALPLFAMEDTFLENNTGSRSKQVTLGMMTFYLLSGKMDLAGKYFAKAREMEGDPADLSGLETRLEAMTALKAAQGADAAESQLTKELETLLTDAIKEYRRKKYDWAFRNVERIMDKSEARAVYLKPLSDKCRQDLGKDLTGFVTALMDECDYCAGKRIVTCIRCDGQGRIRSALGRASWIRCGVCAGRKTIKCPYCNGRCNSKKAAAIKETLQKILK